MPDLKEIYGIVTQQTPPKPGALERQHREQRRRTTRRKAGVYGLVAALVILGGVLVVSRRSDHAQPAIPGATATPSNMLPFGPLEPGSYLISAIDRWLR